MYRSSHAFEQRPAAGDGAEGYPAQWRDAGAGAYTSFYPRFHGYGYGDETHRGTTHAPPPPPHLQSLPAQATRAGAASAAAPGSSGAVPRSAPVEEPFESTLRLGSSVHTRGYSAGVGDSTVEFAAGTYGREFRPPAVDYASSPRDAPRAGSGASAREVRAPVPTPQAKAERGLGAPPEFEEWLPRGRGPAAEEGASYASPGASSVGARAGEQGTPGTPQQGAAASEQRDFSSAYSEDALFIAFLQFATFGQSKLQVRCRLVTRARGQLLTRARLAAARAGRRTARLRAVAEDAA